MRCRWNSRMIWRSRSLSIRSAISIALSRPASSGRASAGVITKQVNHSRSQLAAVLTLCTAINSLPSARQCAGARERDASRALRVTPAVRPRSAAGSRPARRASGTCRPPAACHQHHAGAFVQRGHRFTKDRPLRLIVLRGLHRLARPADWTVHQHRTDRPPQTVLLALYLAMADLRRLNAA